MSQTLITVPATMVAYREVIELGLKGKNRNG